MKIDLKHLYKARVTNLSFSQRRLLYAISKEPTAHLYSREYMDRYQFTRGGVASGLRQLTKRALVGLEDGVWRVQPPEMRVWLKALHENRMAAAESLGWAALQPDETLPDLR